MIERQISEAPGVYINCNLEKDRAEKRKVKERIINFKMLSHFLSVVRYTAQMILSLEVPKGMS